MKLKGILIGIITLIVLLTVSICFVIGSGILNPVEHNLKLGYKYLEEGNYEEALVAFDKVISIDEKNVDAYLGKAQAEIKLDNKADALDTIETIITITSESNKMYSSTSYDQVMSWWIDNADSESDSFERNLNLLKADENTIVDSYYWSDPMFEDKEPYREYQVLYVNDNPTDQIRYTGKTKPRIVSLSEDEAEEKLKDWLGNLGTWVAGEENVLVCDGLHTCEGKEYYQFRLRGWVYDHATTLTWYVISKDGTDMFEGQCINGKLDRW